jgi:hypothetical protein
MGSFTTVKFTIQALKALVSGYLQVPGIHLVRRKNPIAFDLALQLIYFIIIYKISDLA